MEIADWTAVSWRKGSFSGNTGGACIEVADIAWRTSSHSTNTGGQCVEVGVVAPVVAVRDSKDPDGPKLLLSADAWKGLLNRAAR
ncbi:DUF397 domain-containing protein [Spirillospora sp. NPDC049652]